MSNGEWLPISKVSGLVHAEYYGKHFQDVQQLVPSLLTRKGIVDTCQDRKLIHYGARANFNDNICERAVPFTGKYKESKLLPLEPWMTFIVDLLAKNKLITTRLNQANLIFYRPGAGIRPHYDSAEDYGPEIVMITLVGTVSMEFTHPATQEKARKFMEPGHLLICKSAARYQWQHSIPATTEDFNENTGQWVKRDPWRISLILRETNPARPWKNGSYWLCRNCRNLFLRERTSIHFCNLCLEDLPKRIVRNQEPRPSFDKYFLPSRTKRQREKQQRKSFMQAVFSSTLFSEQDWLRRFLTNKSRHF